MFWNHKRLCNKILSLVLVCALSVSLLSGCGQSNNTGNGTDTASTKENLERQREAEQAVQSASSLLAEQSEETEDLVEQLGRAVEKEDTKEIDTLADTLADKLAETKKDTEKWLAAQQEVTKDLSGDAAKTLKERQEAFGKELEAGEQEAEEALKKLGEALEKGDMETVLAETAHLQDLLVEKEEPKTYGDTLPNEVPISVAGEQEYEEEKPEDTEATDAEGKQTATYSTTAAAISLSSTEEQKLLVTEGDTALNERITEKAEELGTPLAIYNYLKNNIGYEYYYGSRKGAAGTLDAMGGNDLDQASLLVAMLRHLGYPAEYVRGDILLTEEQALSLTGANTFRQASEVLAANGTPVTRLTRGEEIVYIRMEHVWVRAYVPYTDYRGAGNAGGDSVWIDLDTGIKAYEAVDNIYDVMEEQGFTEEAEDLTKTGDTGAIEDMLNQWEETLQSQDLSETYARKRIIKQEEVSYLPLSLQYTVEKESKTFEQVANAEKDRVSFEVNGDVLASFTASELQGKNILLSFQPASAADQAIYDRYSSIFDVPAYAVYMKPVLLVDNEVVAKGESYLESTLGTKGSFTINLTSGGRNTSVTNDVTTGSMYAVTLDSQSITAEELQSVYDEAAALKDSVTEANVYSEEYLGKLLSLAGKLYFAQVDIADTMAADMYDVAVTRSLSEGITGYEVRTSSLYGRVTSLSEGSLYIDVDTDSHSVVSLNDEEDVAREYMSSTGMTSSLYESTVWEELTGYESVSTISILAKAQEENVDILLISSANINTEIEKLNTDETTKQSVINAVNSGMIVTIPAEEITMGEWSGTGYIVTNPETGAGAYMISGGLNGGSTAIRIGIDYIIGTVVAMGLLASEVMALVATIGLLTAAIVAGSVLAIALGVLSVICSVVGIVYALNLLTRCEMLYYDLLLGDLDDALESAKEIEKEIIITIATMAIFKGSVRFVRYVASRFGREITTIINELLRRLTSPKIQNIINKYGISVEKFSELLQYDRALSETEKEIVDVIRDEIGVKPKEGTEMAKFIPEVSIDKYLDGTYPEVRGYVSEAEYSKNLVGFDAVYEGNRLDYINSDWNLNDAMYGKITYKFDSGTNITIPRKPPTAETYPYTGKGFTASKNIILPEWEQAKQAFKNGDKLEILDSATGDLIETYIYNGNVWEAQ